MAATRVKQKISFVKGTKNPADKKREILRREEVSVSAYMAVPFWRVICLAFLHYVAKNIFAGIIYLPALFYIATVRFILIPATKINRVSPVILKRDPVVVLCLLATHKIAGTSYMGQLLPNCQPISSHE